MKRKVWSGDWPIPKRLVLPGVTIRVKLLNTADMEQMGGRYGAWSYAAPTSDLPDAVIYLNSDIPIESQRYVLLHELQHALVELLDVMIEKFPEHVQTGAMMKMAGLKAEEVSGVSS